MMMKPSERLARLERALESATAPGYDEQAMIALLRDLGESLGARWPGDVTTARGAWEWLMGVAIRNQPDVR